MIGEALRLLRIFNGYKSVDVAKQIGTSQGYISEIENGRKQPSLEVLEKYANMFGMKLSTLVLFSESIQDDENEKKGTQAKQYVARAGMKFLGILDKVGKLEDE